MTGYSETSLLESIAIRKIVVKRHFLLFIRQVRPRVSAIKNAPGNFCFIEIYKLEHCTDIPFAVRGNKKDGIFAVLHDQH